MKRLTPDEENKFLKQKLANEKKINAALQEEIELLHFEIERLRRNAGIEKVLGSFQSKAFAAAAADLLLDPAPMELLCSGEKADTSETYLVRLSDVLAIHSRKRPKDIFLKKAIRPRSGGREQVKITFDKNDINFDELLTAIQRGSNYLLRVHNSFAVHIFHYVFSKKKKFVLHEQLQTDENRDVHEIPIDSKFDQELYHTRLFEIDKLFQHQSSYQLSLQKIEEINELKQELGIA
ncbi:hypothetical protein [Lacibacter sp.]|uniref:hypothetical protein n=1 Tax=Lacibacter sp. TaxID=1915409 RepID=UPI002B4AB944|nr:hypothetical protein [Lacibacter sp.]HLP39509.1 hypothetical protein [Lacibacter sp.]